MQSQTELIQARDWEVMIVLDACRFNTFHTVHHEYLEGTLRKVRSPASVTVNWLKKTFPKYYPQTSYVSGTPFVNSRGISRSGWTGTDHFRAKNIIDVWDTGWDDAKGTVPPQAVVQAARPILRDRDDNETVIVHFMQPHAPYLSIDHRYNNREGKQRERDDATWLKRLKRSLGPAVLRVFGMEGIFRLKKVLGMRPSIDGEEMWRELDMETWREAYRQNLRAVLEVLPSLVEEADGRVVVSSDHGEALGDDGIYMHPMGVDIPVLREVPWLEVSEPSPS